MLVVFIIIRLLSFLPTKIHRLLGNILGSIAYTFAKSRRRIGLINLSLCFPEMAESEKNNIIKAHFKVLMTSVLEYSLVFYGSKTRLQNMITYKNKHVLDEYYGSKPVILLSPHFVGLDLAGVRMTLDYVGFTLAVKQKNPYVNAQLIKARSRFLQGSDGEVITRDKGLRPIIKKLKNTKNIFYYLPDQDFGETDSVFVPFFAYPECATVSALPKLTKLGDAVVIPMVVYQTKTGYEIEFFKAFADYPTDNVENDVISMNKFIEKVALAHINEYYWLHKRFKTQKGVKERGLIYKESK